MKRLIVAALAALCIAAPALPQTPTLKLNAPPLADALGEPVAKTWTAWQDQQRRALLKLKPVTVGDVVEPELGADNTKVPDIVAPNYDRAPLVESVGLPGTAAPDNVGAFRFMCEPGQISYDDPVVFPGQSGKSHLHQWFGNLSANANSTYKSLRTSGDSTCVNILNRSAYWMPAMLDGKGHVVRPDYIAVYYKQLPKDSPLCGSGKNPQGIACVPLPRGLRYVMGYDMVTGKTATGGSYFNCDGPSAKPGHYATITEAAANCPAGNRLGAIIFSPGCWDGKRLDSANHRDHMANPDFGWWGYLKCPDTHPYVVPSFTMGAWYSVEAGDRAPGWYLSSDEMSGMERMPAGSTFHADWFGAWDDATMAVWMEKCINALKSCSNGVLGDGTAMRQRNGGVFQWKANPRLVPVPARPQ